MLIFQESMKMMGLKPWLNWTAWFVKYLMLLGVSVGLIVLLLKLETNSGKAVLIYTDWIVLFLFLMVYSAATIMYCFMVSTLFHKGNKGLLNIGEHKR